MKSYTKIFISLFCLVILFCQQASSETLLSKKAEEWPDACNALKKQYLTASQLYVTFSEKPRPKISGQIWVLKMKGIDIPIPAVSYEHIYIGREIEFGMEEYSIMLISPSQKMYINFFVSKNEPIKDMFAFWNMDKSKGEETPEGIEATNVIFGGPVFASDLYLLGNEKTPDDLTCKKEEWIRESRIAVALILKTIGTTGLEAVYRGVGRYHGMTAKLKGDNKVRYSSPLFFHETPGRIYEVQYAVPQDNQYQDIGLLFGDSLTENIGNPPAWLNALNSALASGDKGTWNSFLAEAEKAGFSTRSIQRSRKSLELAK